MYVHVYKGEQTKNVVVVDKSVVAVVVVDLDFSKLKEEKKVSIEQKYLFIYLIFIIRRITTCIISLLHVVSFLVVVQMNAVALI